MLSAFRDENGDFKAANPKDIDAFVALHEASYLAFPGEAMLNEARAFAVKKLEELMPSMSTFMGPASQTERQGDLPLHWKVPRLQATWSLKQHGYNEESHLSIDPSIRQLAAVDFNLVQAVHGAELVEVTKWWKETGLGEKLPFARDRLVECFFCAACIAPEPRLAPPPPAEEYGSHFGDAVTHQRERGSAERGGETRETWRGRRGNSSRGRIR